MFAALGVYASSASVVDLVMLVLIGLLGFVLRRFGLPLAPVLIAVSSAAANESSPSIASAPRSSSRGGKCCGQPSLPGICPGAMPVRAAAQDRWQRDVAY